MAFFIRENPILSSERMLHEGYDRKSSVERKKKQNKKNTGCDPQKGRRQTK
jgi:hypothetical protein